MARVRYSFSSRRTRHIENIGKQRKKYPKVARDVINISDIILEVLDARFIEETRNKKTEEYIEKKGKKIIYVLNKSDLINMDEKKELAKNLGVYVFVSCKERRGARELRKRIKIEVSRLKTDYKRFHVGVIGYPNTGKSSLINFLTGKPGARTGAEAGFTKGMQLVKMTKDILIIDTPGVIPEEKYSTENRLAWQYAKLNAKTYDKIKEPEFIIHKLMHDFSDKIESYYGVNAQGDAEKLIEELGKKRNFLVKGGKVDEDRTARLILREWQQGNIKV